jgi:hypothetical protein
MHDDDADDGEKEEAVKVLCVHDDIKEILALKRMQISQLRGIILQLWWLVRAFFQLY